VDVFHVACLQIQSASVDRREARREQKQNEAIAALKRMYPNSELSLNMELACMRHQPS
jgi:hypothetical protein